MLFGFFLSKFVYGTVVKIQGNNLLIYSVESIFLNPNSSDPVVRNQPFTIEDILSYGVNLRYRFSESVLFGISRVVDALLADLRVGRHEAFIRAALARVEPS